MPNIDPDELEQVASLCDVFDYDPDEFKTVVKDPKELTRVDELSVTTPFDTQERNKINQLGLGPKIIELKRKGWSIQSIAEHFGLSRGIVDDWWDTFSLMNPKQKQVFAQSMVKNDLFNVTQQAQNAYEQLIEMKDELKDNPELWLAFSAETRAFQKFASDLIKTHKMEERHQKNMDIVIEEVRKESPECAMRILKRIQTINDTRGFMGG
jgi:transposase